MHLEENLRMTIPEIQPLQDKEDKEEQYAVPELQQKKPGVPFSHIKTQVINILNILLDHEGGNLA